MTADDILIFSGSGSPKLTLKICEYLHVQPGEREVLRFSEGNLFVRVQENVRGRRVYLVQSTVFPANDHFMELLFWIDALKRASAESVTVVMPYFVVVSPDTGFAKQARKYASFLGTSIAIADKQRKAHDERAEVLEIIGEVQGKTALIVDDFTISAGTLADAAEKLVERGAKAVYAAVSHGVFSEGSMERLDRSPIHRLLVTDSIETQPVVLSPKVEVVSVAPLLGEAIRRIHNRESISVLFPA